MSTLESNNAAVDLVGVGAELTHEITQLLFHEAKLLDERRFAEWLDLLADDLHYWLPLRRNSIESEHTTRSDLAHFDDDKARVQRAGSPSSPRAGPGRRSRRRGRGTS